MMQYLAASWVEYACSLFPSTARIYCAGHKGFLASERAEVERHADLRFQRLVVVGGGPVPFTALYWADFLKVPIVVLDRSRAANRLAKRLIHRLGLRSLGSGSRADPRRAANPSPSIDFVDEPGEAFGGYRDSLVSISLFAQNKSAIVDRIRETGNANTLILLRLHVGDSIGDRGLPWSTVEHPHDFVTLAARLPASSRLEL